MQYHISTITQSQKNNSTRRKMIMKKILSIALALVMMLSCVAVFASCKAPEEKGVKVIEIKLTEEEYAFAVQKGNTALLNQLNDFMAEIKGNGKFEEIVNKYFGDGTPTPVVSAKEKKTDGSQVGTGVFNGDVGIIHSIEPATESMTVVFDDREAEYDFTQLGELEPAYAMTVHKSQGSEYRAVILTAWNGSPYLLSRSILYTAITRARELLIIVGKEETVGVMVENAKKNRRYSGLKLRLQGKCE